MIQPILPESAQGLDLTTDTEAGSRIPWGQYADIKWVHFRYDTPNTTPPSLWGVRVRDHRFATVWTKHRGRAVL